MKSLLKNPIVVAGFLLLDLVCVLLNPIIFGGKTFGSSDSLAPKAVGIALNSIQEKPENFLYGSHGFSVECPRQKHLLTYRNSIFPIICLICFFSRE